MLGNGRNCLARAEKKMNEKAIREEDQWYSQGGKKHRMGPVPEGQLKQLASTGQLKPTDLVWKKGICALAGRVRGRGAVPAVNEC